MSISSYIILVFIFIIFIYGLFSKINVYEVFIYGMKEGIKSSINILPYLMSMYIAVRLLDASGIISDFIRISKIPNEIIMQFLFKPLSSNASLSYMLEVFNKYGVDSTEGMVSSILQGASDTTLYVITLYLGSIGITKYRYSIVVGLLSDVFCFIICIVTYFIIF